MNRKTLPSWEKVTPETWDRAQKLRKGMTPAEKRLCNALRQKQMGVDFRRQHPIGPYITDFYAPEVGLIVEVDGDTHNDPQQIAHDEIRTEFFAAYGLRVKRYWNREIMMNLDGVLQDIRSSLNSAPPIPPASGGEPDRSRRILG